MSAYLCNPDHISAIAFALVELGICERELYLAGAGGRYFGIQEKLRAAQLVGEVLYLDNCLSVASRYSEKVDTKFNLDEKTARSLLSDTGEHELSKLPAIRLIKATFCFRHQACEHRGWPDSPSDRLTQDLVLRLTRLLPGYEQAVWGW